MLNKKILLSILIIGTVAVVAGAGTWAAFTDTETSTANTFTAGTLDLKIDGADSIIKQVIEAVAPGDSDFATVKVKNAGTIDGTLNIKIANLVDSDELPNTEPEGLVDLDTTTGELSDWITIKIEDGVSATPIYEGPLSGLETTTGINYDLPKNTERSFKVTYTVNELSTEQDNIIQGDKASYDIVLTLTQK